MPSDEAIQEKVATSARIVAWPSPQDYNEAVQNPSDCFAEGWLRDALVELNQLGLPRPATGNFATVYRFHADQRDVAVRCFLHPLQDQHETYHALTKCLRDEHPPYCVPFEFVPDGIKVKGHWYPIVRMEWAHGTPILEYVQANLNEPDRIRALAENFREVVLDMLKRGIAHGDLQHGNIMVDDGNILLIDYDGFFVPTLQGQPSKELGHANYQHPLRDESYFDNTLDSFSAWLIYLSLMILSDDPQLWTRVPAAGDERLLFGRNDLFSPGESHVFYVLENHNLERIRLYARFLRSLLLQSPRSNTAFTAEVEDPGDLPEIVLDSGFSTTSSSASLPQVSINSFLSNSVRSVPKVIVMYFAVIIVLGAFRMISGSPAPTLRETEQAQSRAQVQSLIDSVEHCLKRADACFMRSDFRQAAQLYTQAIKLQEELPSDTARIWDAERYRTVHAYQNICTDCTRGVAATITDATKSALALYDQNPKESIGLIDELVTTVVHGNDPSALQPLIKALDSASQDAQEHDQLGKAAELRTKSGELVSAFHLHN